MPSYSTRDVQLATFFRLRGFPCTKIELDDHLRGIMWFDITEEQSREMGLGYGNSEHAPFEGIRRGLLKQIDNLKEQRRLNRRG